VEKVKENEEQDIKNNRSTRKIKRRSSECNRGKIQAKTVNGVWPRNKEKTPIN
jgi:hypothetical protein